MDPAGADGQAAPGDMMEHSVHEQIAAKGSGCVGDIGGNTRTAHGLDHGADRQCGVIRNRPSGRDRFILWP